MSQCITRKINYFINKDKLTVEGSCRHNFSNTKTTKKIIDKLTYLIKEPYFKKEFFFKENELKIKIESNYPGTENIPIIGSIKKPAGFTEKEIPKIKSIQSIFEFREDQKIFSKDFENKIEYVLKT